MPTYSPPSKKAQKIYGENGANAALRVRFDISAQEGPREAFKNPSMGSTGKSGSWFLHESLMWRCKVQAECDAWSAKRRPAPRLFLVSPVNFLAEMACFSSDVLLIFTVLICGCCGCGSLFSGLFTLVFVSYQTLAFPLRFSTRESHCMGQ